MNTGCGAAPSWSALVLQVEIRAMCPLGIRGPSMALNPHYANLAEPLGHLVIEFNSLETDMGYLIARLLKQDNMVAAVFTTQSFSSKLAFARTFAVLKVIDGELLQEMEGVLNEAADVNSERNTYIHSEYLPFLDAQDNLLEVLRTKLRDRVKAFSATDKPELDKLFPLAESGAITALAERINAVALRVRTVAKKYQERNP
jgi:hypothetical protein